MEPVIRQSSIVHQTFQQLTDALEAYDQELFDLDVGDLKLELSFDAGHLLLITYHYPTEQLWISSPLSGAHHFACINETWQCTRSNHELFDFLNQELQKLTGKAIHLNAP